MDFIQMAVEAHLKLAYVAAQARLERLEKERPRLSRHYSRMRQTQAVIGLLEEVRGIAAQDPEHWDDDEDIVPF